MEFLKFLKQTFELEKMLFLLIVFFILGQILFTHKGIETFPFYNYGMYSAKFSKLTSLDVLTIKVNDKKIYLKESGYKSKSFISNQINYYYYHKKDIHFGKWLKSYLQKSSSEKISKIDLLVSKYSSNYPYQLIKEDVYPLYIDK